MSLPSPTVRLRSGGEKFHGLAIDYWAGSEIDGRWNWRKSVEDVAVSWGLRKSDVPKFAKKGADAFNLQSCCVRCSSAEPLTSRSSLAAKRFGSYKCVTCISEETEVRRKQWEEAEVRRKQKERAVVVALANRYRTFNYEEIGYEDAVYAFTVMLASDDACELGSFSDVARLHLASSDRLSNQLLERLKARGVLFFAENTPTDAVTVNDDGTYTYSAEKVHWRFAKAETGISLPRVMELLGAILDQRDSRVDYATAVSKLWWDVGFDDALSHLMNEVSTYRLPSVRLGEKTEAALRYALSRFSIPQVRRQITSVVKNAASLANRRDFVSRQALNTIPGTLMSNVDRASSEGWQVYPMLRNWENEEPWLTTVLFNRVLGSGLPGFRSLVGAAFPFDSAA